MVSIARIAIAVVFLWITAGLLSWASYSTPKSASLVGAARAQLLPEVPTPTDLKAEAARLHRKAIWPVPVTNVAADATAGKTVVEQWSRIAIVTEPSGNYALLSSPAGIVKSFKAGDTLPDGSTLVKVSVDEIVIRAAAGKKQSVHLLN